MTVNGRRRAVVYAWTLRQRARARRFTEAVHDGWWLGVLDPPALAHVDETLYSSLTEVVDGVPRQYSDPAYIQQGLFEWERAAVARFPAGGRVTVTSAGSGREVQGLLAAGFDAHGFEPHRGLVEAGRRVLSDPERLQLCDRDTFPEAAANADAVVIGWGAYMLIPGRSRRIELLRSAARTLPPGGPLLISFFVRPPNPYFQRLHRVANLIRRLRRAEGLELGDGLTPNFAHYFTSQEISSELSSAGFELRQFCERPYGHAIATKTAAPEAPGAREHNA